MFGKEGLFRTSGAAYSCTVLLTTPPNGTWRAKLNMTDTSQSTRISADVEIDAPAAAETDAIGHQLPSPSGNPDGPEARPTHSTSPRVTDLGHEAALASAPHGGPTSASFAWAPQLGKAVREDYFVDPPAPSASKVRFRPRVPWMLPRPARIRRTYRRAWHAHAHVEVNPIRPSTRG